MQSSVPLFIIDSMHICTLHQQVPHSLYISMSNHLIQRCVAILVLNSRQLSLIVCAVLRSYHLETIEPACLQQEVVLGMTQGW